MFIRNITANRLLLALAVVFFFKFRSVPFQPFRNSNFRQLVIKCCHESISIPFQVVDPIAVTTLVAISSALLVLLVILVCFVVFSYRAKKGCFKPKVKSSESEAAFYPYEAGERTKRSVRVTILVKEKSWP